MAFKKATKKKTRLRLALMGPSGSGKTYSALAIGKHLGQRVAVIDTERGSASKYADDVAEFDTLELTTFAPAKYIAAMREAAVAGYDVLVVDSLSHAWFGADGILDQKDKKGGNSFDAWRTLTPQHNDLVEAILAFPGHIICTMRSKMEYVQEKDSKGKTVVRKVGMAPVQREGMEYEFDVIGEMDIDHALHITKSRCPDLSDAIVRKPGKDVADSLLGWLGQGVEEQPAPTDAPAKTPAGADAHPSSATGTSGGSSSSTVPRGSSTTTDAPKALTFDVAPAMKLARMCLDAKNDEDVAYCAAHVESVVDESDLGKRVAAGLNALVDQASAYVSHLQAVRDGEVDANDDFIWRPATSAMTRDADWMRKQLARFEAKQAETNSAAMAQ